MNLFSLFNHFISIKYLFLFFSMASLVNCNDKNTGEQIAYFGGQIINPKSDKVYFYKDEVLLDSSKLNIHNKFLIKLDSFALGLYTFKHGNEFQYIYMEPSDSLLIRLNTWDFDESLVFSGKGAERNNFLINLFLENQKEDKLFYKFYHLNDSLFEIKIDSVLERKNLLYTQFKSELSENSELFDKLVNVAIKYPLYKKKEAYPFLHMKKTHSDKHPEIDPSFFKFRKSVNLDDLTLNNYYAHYNYVKSYLYHLAHERQVIDSSRSNLEVNLMQVALEKIENETIKNRFLQRGIWMTLMDEKIPSKEKERAKRLFFDHCTDKKSVSEVANLINASDKLAKGYQLPKLTSYNYNNIVINLNDIIKNKNTVIYTWPTKLSEIENFTKRINYLEKKYADYLFIGVNSACSESEWKKQIKLKQLNKSHQYRVDKGVEWLDINFSRAILIDKDGVVQNNMTHLANPRFEKQLKTVLH